MSTISKPNQNHIQIDQLAKTLTRMGKKVVLATQNIDDLHIKPQNNEYEYYNIHGNCKQVRCNQHHFQEYDPRKKDDKCKVCGGEMRPHILFFDECYGKDYGAEIKDKTYPLVICIGSSVKTGLAINMIQRAEEVVEINPEPVIEIGKVYRFTNKTEEVLRNVIVALNNLVNSKQLINKKWICILSIFKICDLEI